MVVVLPAPFGPRMPVTAPAAALSVSPSTAVIWPYRLTSLPISTAGTCGTVLTDASLRRQQPAQRGGVDDLRPPREDSVRSLCCHEHDNEMLTRPAPTKEDGPMDQDRARSLLIAERDEVQGLLKDAETAGQEDRQAEVDSEAEDEADAALALTEEGQDGAIAERLRK